MTTLYLIRHAEADGNLYRRAHGWYNSVITDLGYRQIAALAKRFATESFGEMKTPVLFNCLGHEKSAEDSIPALLEKQVQSSVYMEDTLRRLGELGVTEILEVGPGKALSGFVKKTLGPDVPCTAVETAEELAAFLTKWKEAHA